jgi:hypothetical protein
MNKYKGKEFDCPIIGINLSVEYWRDQDYFVTVAYDRLADIAAGKITARKAVFTCLHKAHAIPDSIPQPIAYADMSKPDIYAKSAEGIFDIDLTKPTYKTFGGLFATQVAWFLGYNPVYVVGFDGGTHHFKPYRRDNIPAEYHNACFGHVKYWLMDNPEYMLYNCNENSAIEWFDYKEPPFKGE